LDPPGSWDEIAAPCINFPAFIFLKPGKEREISPEIYAVLRNNRDPTGKRLNPCLERLFLHEIILTTRKCFVNDNHQGDLATSPVMKRDTSNKVEANEKMGWMNI